MIKFSI